MTALYSARGIALDRVQHLRDRFGGKPIKEYAANATGNVVPLSTISRPSTALSQPRGIALYKDVNIFVTNHLGGFLSANASVTEYPSGSNGTRSHSRDFWPAYRTRRASGITEVSSRGERRELINAAVIVALALVISGALYVHQRWRRSPRAYRATIGLSIGYFIAGALVGALLPHLVAADTFLRPTLRDLVLGRCPGTIGSPAGGVEIPPIPAVGHGSADVVPPDVGIDDPELLRDFCDTTVTLAPRR